MENINLERIGIENFRDIGGYGTDDGRVVKRNMLYRSAKLDRITEAGQELLDGLGVKTIVDFRDDEEVANSPTAYDREGLLKLRLPVLGGDIKSYLPYLAEGKLKKSDAQALMCTAYRSFVTSYSKQYALFMEVLLKQENYPIIFHCTAGKDRTGYAAALLLTFLGVPWNDVLDNYLLTNEYLKNFISQIDLSKIPSVTKDLFDVLMLADEQYLDTAFNVIGRDGKAVASYMETVLSFDGSKQGIVKSILLE